LKTRVIAFILVAVFLLLLAAGIRIDDISDIFANGRFL